VLIRVVAAGVNPVDVMVRQGRLQNEFPHAFPLIPGWDAAGVVEEFGEGAGRFRKGDRVWSYTRKPLVQWGSYAEYVAVPESSVALMPSKLLYEEAAAVPVAGLTAFQSLFGHRAIGSGASVLVHAAAGSVGGIAVQLARNAGARVIGTAGPENQDYIAALGAVAVDYTAEDFADAVGRHFPDGVDLVIDGVGGEVTARSLAVIRRGGRLVALVDPPDLDAAAQRNVIAQNLISEPNSEQLGLLARMYEQGTLRQPHLQKIYPLAEAAEAQRVVAEGHVRGKLVLNL
jgi:NADPH2:quinone reductase